MYNQVPRLKYSQILLKHNYFYQYLEQTAPRAYMVDIQQGNNPYFREDKIRILGCG